MADPRRLDSDPDPTFHFHLDMEPDTNFLALPKEKKYKKLKKISNTYDTKPKK